MRFSLTDSHTTQSLTHLSLFHLRNLCNWMLLWRKRSYIYNLKLLISSYRAGIWDGHSIQFLNLRTLKSSVNSRERESTIEEIAVQFTLHSTWSLHNVEEYKVK